MSDVKYTAKDLLLSNSAFKAKWGYDHPREVEYRASKHTSTPFVVKGNLIVSDANGIVVAMLSHGPFKEIDAAFIVRACNSHEELVQILESALKGHPNLEGNIDGKPAWVDQARAALAKARP